MTTITCEIQWLTYLLQDFKVPFEQPSLLYRDNYSTRYIATNLVFHERTKHIEIDYHVVREKLKVGSLVHLLPISTIEQLADIYTKALSPQSFKSICYKLSLINICSSACGGIKGYGYKNYRRMLILIVSFLILRCFSL